MINEIEQILRQAKTIAVVGLSNNRSRPAYEVAKYLQESGYRIVPVNPLVDEVLGEKAYPNLLSVPYEVDIVDVFRNPIHVPEIVEEAILKQVRLIWMQPGAENYDAADRAQAAGIPVVIGLCMRIRHRETLQQT